MDTYESTYDPTYAEQAWSDDAFDDETWALEECEFFGWDTMQPDERDLFAGIDR